MASRSVAPHGMAVDDSEQSTFAEVSLDPWDGADPYICRFHSTEDGVSGKAYTPVELQLIGTMTLCACVTVHRGWLWKRRFHKSGDCAACCICRLRGAPWRSFHLFG